MLAQKTTAAIDAIEIDENAYLQAIENFEQSKWKDRLTVLLGDVKTYPFSKKYDFIVCNPPFYQNEKASDLHEEKIAKHSLHLTLPYLLTAIDNLLSDNGRFANVTAILQKR